MTRHTVRCGDARTEDLGDDIALVVTSPPYPMVEMWDEALGDDARDAITRGDGPAAFEAMHRVLDVVWERLRAVMVPGGIVAIAIGDGARTLSGRFVLWPNRARVTMAMAGLGFDVLPDIVWHKPTNAPNKYLGSGMLPAGAYVTYEHEAVLLFRNGAPRRFTSAEARDRRRRSAFFWEERNAWFSDIWRDLPGAPQGRQGGGRSRSAAFPVELAARLVDMCSVQGDVVLDPFAGTGTTGVAAAASGRHSLQIEADPHLAHQARERLAECVAFGAGRLAARLEQHGRRVAAGLSCTHHNSFHGVPVKTAQETDLQLVTASAWTPSPTGGDAEVVAVPTAAEARRLTA